MTSNATGDNDQGKSSLRAMQDMLDEHFKASLITYSCLSYQIHGLSASGFRTRASSATADSVNLNENFQSEAGHPGVTECHDASDDPLWIDDGPVGEGIHHVTAAKPIMGGAVGQNRDQPRRHRLSALHAPTVSQLTESQTVPSKAGVLRFSEEVSSTQALSLEENLDHKSADQAHGLSVDNDAPVRSKFSEIWLGPAKASRLQDTPYIPPKSAGSPTQVSFLYKICIEVLPPDHHYVAYFKVCQVSLTSTTIQKR